MAGDSGRSDLRGADDTHIVAVVGADGRCHDDFAALRRYLVDEGFLARRDGYYWRSGGTVHV